MENNGNVMEANEAYKQTKEMRQKNKQQSIERYQTFLEKSEKLLTTINKKINYAIACGETSISCIALPTCLTINIFEKILKYHLERLGYTVQTEILLPQSIKIKESIDTSVVALTISWNNTLTKEQLVQKEINELDDTSIISDGYHTFGELYYHRAVLFAMICNEHPDRAWKSLQHFNPDDEMFEGMFIVGIDTPYGQVTYHYDLPYWDMFKVPILERGKEWDGSTPDECINRMKKWSEN